MAFKKCSIDGHLFEDENDQLKGPTHIDRSVQKFLEILALWWCFSANGTINGLP